MLLETRTTSRILDTVPLLHTRPNGRVRVAFHRNLIGQDLLDRAVHDKDTGLSKAEAPIDGVGHHQQRCRKSLNIGPPPNRRRVTPRPIAPLANEKENSSFRFRSSEGRQTSEERFKILKTRRAAKIHRVDHETAPRNALPSLA